jgi:hypothetical protein
LRSRDKQNAAALGGGVADRFQSLVQHRHALGEVDDVDVVAGTEDEITHLRVPTVGLMAEVNASFQQLAHAVIGQRHYLLRLFRGGRVSSNLAA